MKGIGGDQNRKQAGQAHDNELGDQKDDAAIERSIRTPMGRDRTSNGIPPTNPESPTKKAESVICKASQPTATWYIQKAVLVRECAYLQ